MQPNATRFNPLVDLVVLTHELNPEAHFVFLGHNRLCGGVNYYTEGRAKGWSHDEEISQLTLYLKALSGRLQQRSVPRDLFRIGISHIGDGDDFLGIRDI